MQTKKRPLTPQDLHQLSLWRKRNLQTELKTIWHTSPPVWAIIKGADYTPDGISDRLGWHPERTARAIQTAIASNLLHQLKNGNLRLVDDRHKTLRRRLIKQEEKRARNRSA